MKKFLERQNLLELRKNQNIRIDLQQVESGLVIKNEQNYKETRPRRLLWGQNYSNIKIGGNITEEERNRLIDNLLQKFIL